MSADEVVGRDVATGRCVAIQMENGRIARIEETQEQSDWWIGAGLIDLQVNGYEGFDINADDVTGETVERLTDRLLQRGVTTFLPTVISASEEKICHVLSTIADARRRSPRVAAAIPCVHMEGPHISPLDGYRGAHDACAVRAPSVAEFERWQGVCGGLVGMVTMSPHYPESAAYIAHLSQFGVHVALGHTHAEGEQIRRAVDLGARISTHLGNGLASEVSRHRNPIWPQLADDRLTASVIADGHHLPADLLQVILRSKGPGRVVLVSDSIALAGMPAGRYRTPVGGSVVLREDGRLCVEGTELLAGSTATLAECVAGMVSMTKISLAEAMRMATSQPGRFVGGRGVLAKGAAADLLRFRWNGQIDVDAVWLRGEMVYARTAW